MLELHQECLKVVKLVMELHHMNQGGDQGELWNRGATMWALSCEFQE